MAGRLADRRVLVTQAENYMGPAIAELFREEGARVVADPRVPNSAAAVATVLADAGEVEILVANLAMPPLAARAVEQQDDAWTALFEALVDPLMRFTRGVLPGMLARGWGKVVAVTSAAPLRGIPGVSAYCAARGAQNAYVRSVGLEVASANIQVNAIAQNYVKNDTYYPSGLVDGERFRQHIQHQVPIGRVAEPRETADLALFLASDASNFIVGQVIPFAGGWATTTG